MNIIHVHEIRQREQRIAQLEAVIDHQANVISSMADELARLRRALEK